MVSVGCGEKQANSAPAPVATTANEPTSPKANTPVDSPASSPESPAAPVVSTERVTNRPANTKGKVLIAEYHHISNGKGDMYRSPKEFRQDLERLHKMGFRPLTVSQYLEDKMPLPPGASPVVFTFDDSNPSQFQLRPDGSVDPNCAIGIWQDFAKSHPDFPIRATFYVLPDVMWGQPQMVEKKVAMLREMGCELGNHTVTHPQLKRLSDEKVKFEIGSATERLEKFGEKLPVSLALPFGISPKNKSLLKGFDYNGKRVTLSAVMLVGADPAPAPTDPKLNRMAIPRIQAYNGPMSLDHWLKQVEKGAVKVYVQP